MSRQNSWKWPATGPVFTTLLAVVLLFSIAVADINEQVAQLDFDTETLDDIIAVFGEPVEYLWLGQTYTRDNLPDVYIARYPNEFDVVMVNGHIDEVRFESPEAGYLYQGEIQVGSSLEHVLDVVGPPIETVAGRPFVNEDGVLYKDINGTVGYCYYRRSDQNVRFFFWDYNVSALYVTGNVEQPHEPNSLITFPKIDRRPAPSALGTHRKALSSIPSYDPTNVEDAFQVDLRGYDLSAVDLSSSLADLCFCLFDSQTNWPPAQQMPPEFDYDQIMELGKNPGLGIRDLHAQGVTGAHVGIAIIDQPLLTEHEEYADRLRLYEEINVDSNRDAEMHGGAVSSIAVGQTVGVAPGADLYYIAAEPGYRIDGVFARDYVYVAQAIRRILEINDQLPENRKIRVISISMGWMPEHTGYDDIMATCEEARAAGMLVVSSSIERVHGFQLLGLGRHPLADPNAFDSYEPATFWAQWLYDDLYGLRKGDRLLVPMDSRTLASPCGSDEFFWQRCGGISWAIPYVAGVYALAAQVDPAITPEEFWSLAMDTGRTVELRHSNETVPLGTIIDPVALIESISDLP